MSLGPYTSVELDQPRLKTRILVIRNKGIVHAYSSRAEIRFGTVNRRPGNKRQAIRDLTFLFTT